MSILMRDYELSIWDNSKNEEKKIAIIGSPEIFSKARAQEVTLTRNTNGTKSLNFYLYFEYIDTDGEKKVNPYYSLLNTDTKLKLKWKERWYEFVIKSISETTENKKIEYVAEDAFITELSKRGFDVELSTDLENNQGSIFELGERILEKSEWTINKEKSNVKPQIIKDVLVKLKTTSEIKPERKVELDEDDLLIENSNSSITIPKGKIIYTFYPTLKKKEPYFQFYYLESEKYEISDDGFLINCPLYIVEDCKYTKENPYFAEKQEITTSKGKRLIRSQKSYYNSKLKKYVKVYSSKNGSEQIGGYTETEYLTDNFVTNLVTNSTDFINDIGWYSVKNNEIEVTSYPNNDAILKILTSGEEIETINYLKLNFDKLNQPQFYNTGIDDNKKLFSKGLYSGQKFVIKLDFGFSKDATLTNFPSPSKFNKTTKVPYSCLKVALATYNYNEDGEPEIEKVLFETNLTNNNDSTFRKVGNYYTAICSNQQKFSQTQLLEDNLGVFFSYETTSQSSITNDNIEDYYFYIKDFQIFEYKEKSDGTYYSPNEVLDGEAKIKYSYFYENQEYTTSEDIDYLSQSYNPQSYDEVYYDNFMQIRTIEQKESNYFNLLQTLAETFECWVDFLVEHDEQGYLTLNSENRPKKEIVFKPFLGKKNWAGFRKGVNLKQVNREINNSQIITKTIVKPNNNEFAPYGFCTIAYSTENPSGESFIYDFSFYENKKLIDKDLLKARLYEKNGLYPTLKKINNELEDVTNKYTAKSLEIIHLKSQLQILETQINELSVEIATAKKDFRVYSGITYKRFLSEDEEFKTEYLQLSGVSDAVVIIVSNTSKLKKIKEEAKRNRQNLEAAEQEYKELDEKIKKLTLQKEEEIFNFEINYSSYIREGVWVSEDYVDHDLYYADAKVIASTSANPQITYNIDVIDVSGLEEFLNYDFDLGDKTYIIDPEFFGYVEINNQKTPRRQEVVVTEIKEVLESPEANKLVIQNYKTQFEDLFQRITATTQQLKLNEGVYNRAAKAFDYNGLTSEVTENSLNNNNFNLTNSSITWAEDGIITSNMTNNHEAIKIANGSIFTSENSENAWASMITPKGINANYIYTGQLDAGVINIVTELKKDENDNLEYAVTMDKDGLSMYSYSGKKVPRLRLGKILELNTEQQSTEELYGLQLYNKEGQQTFRTDSNGDITMTGTIYAKDGSFSGTISAKQGIIGGWTIDDAALTHKTLGVIDSIITTQKLDARYTVNSFTTDDWRLIFGLNGIKGNFGVNSSGNLFANGVDIKDGNINFGDIFKITSGKDENGNGDTLTYGLNIKLSKENEDKEVVIESDDRVIGIREKVKDDNGNVVTDENGQDKWTWKTILGDLTNATLGGKLLSDYGISGYGLCTENGLFSGTIFAGAGKIGNFEITDNSIVNNVTGGETLFFPTEQQKQATGIYLGNDGRFYCGNGSNYIKFDEKGNLIVKASSLFFGDADISSKFNDISDQFLGVDEIIDGVNQSVNTAINTANGASNVANAASNKADSAAMTATSFLYFDPNNGLLVGEISNGSVGTKGYVQIQSSGVTVGKTNSNKVVINSDGFYIKDDSNNNISSFVGSTITLGKSSSNKVVIDSSGFYIKDGSNNNIATFSETFIELGKNSEQSVVSLCGGSGEIRASTPDEDEEVIHGLDFRTDGRFDFNCPEGFYIWSGSTDKGKSDIRIQFDPGAHRLGIGIDYQTSNTAYIPAYINMEKGTVSIGRNVEFEDPSQVRTNLMCWHYDNITDDYPGLSYPSGGTNIYVRATEKGFLSFSQATTEMTAYNHTNKCSLGTAFYPFDYAYIKTTTYTGQVMVEPGGDIRFLKKEGDSNTHVQGLALNSSGNVVVGGVVISTLNSTVSTYTTDSGWKTVTVNSNFTQHSSNKLKYRKIGKIVNICGAVNPSKNLTMNDDNWYTVFSLPSGYGPPNGTDYFIGQGSNEKIFNIRINGSDVQIGRYRAGGAYSNASTNSAFYINITYIISS